jgi:DNA-binding protein YbaB
MARARGAAAVAEFKDKLTALHARTEAARAALGAASATVTSTDGAVTVSVGAGGVLNDLSFGPSAFDRGPDALAAAVVATVRTAKVRALEQAEHDLTDIVGADSGAVAVLRRRRAELAGPDAGPEGVAPGRFLPDEDEDEDDGYDGRGR